MRRSLRGQRVEVIDDRQDARANRNLVALEAGRIALAVPALVMAVDDRRDRIGKRHRRDNLGAHLRMHLHPLELFVGQRTGLRQDVLRHGELADVVQQRRRPDALDVGRRHAHDARQPSGMHLDATDARGRRLVLGVDGQRQRLDGRQVHVRHLAGASPFVFHAIGVDPVGPVRQVERTDQQRRQPGALARQQHRGRRRHAGADDVAQRAPDGVFVPRPWPAARRW